MSVSEFVVEFIGPLQAFKVIGESGEELFCGRLPSLTLDIGALRVTGVMPDYYVVVLVASDADEGALA